MTKFLNNFAIAIIGFSTFFIISNLQFQLIIVVALASLTLAYGISYWKGGIGAGLAYWYLAYAGLAIVLLGFGLVQTHAECRFLFAECYSEKLPSWFHFLKDLWSFLCLGLNMAAIIVSIIKISRTK